MNAKREGLQATERTLKWLEAAAVMCALVSPLVAIATTWAVTHYRVGAMERRIEAVELKYDKLSGDIVAIKEGIARIEGRIERLLK